MEELNSEVKEVKYTDRDIIQGIMSLDEESRKIISSFSFQQLDAIANDSKYLQSVYDNCDKNIIGYQKMKDAVKAFIDTMHNQEQKGTATVIDNMIEKYKNFSREEKLEFSKKLAGETNLESSIDMFNYNWNKLLKTLGIVSE